MIWNNNGGFESLRKRPFQVILGFDIIVILLALSNSFFDPNNPQEAFVGWAFTLISGSQLLFIGLISWNIQIKRMKEVGEEKRNSRYIWFIIGMGFVFLALDEAFELHEEIDFLIHNRFGIEETGLSDRIDDLVVMTYFIIGMVFLVDRIPWLHWPHWIHLSSLWPLILIGIGVTMILGARRGGRR